MAMVFYCKILPISSIIKTVGMIGKYYDHVNLAHRKKSFLIPTDDLKKLTTKPIKA